MSDEQQLNTGGDNPPIIKKVIKKHGGHHGGAWKVAYADFVTAMMALFIVLWVLAQSEGVKEAVSGYFKDPAGFTDKSGGIFENDLLELRFEAEIMSREMQKEKFQAMQDSIMEALGGTPEFADLLDQVDIQMVDEGMLIEMLEAIDDVFFEIGSAELRNTGREVIRKVGSQISKLPNQIAVEGHTDSRPFLSKGARYTNYELSADRANSARRALMEGVTAEQIDEIRGYADRRLKDEKDPYSVVNRRVSIIIKYRE